MRKMIFILCIPTALLSACSPSGMQGNPAAVQAGAAIGGVLGAIVGDRAGGYNGSQFGALLGTVTGAAVGNAITTPREETYQVEEYYVKTYPSSSQYEHTSSYEPSSGLRIINLRFIDDNRNHVIDAEEDSKLVFDVVNDGESHPAWVCGLKHRIASKRGGRFRHTLRGCIWIEALFTRWSSLWKNCKHSASCVFLFKLL